MSTADRAAFVAAIRENPEDDLPRLVYADWLDEHGEPQRAEFIRVQCELARLTQGEPRYEELKQREQDFLAAHAAAWRGGPFLGLTLGGFECGFICAVTATEFQAFISGIWDVNSLHPIIQLRIGRMRPSQLRRLAKVRLLASVRVLDVSFGTIGNDPIPAFVQSPYVHNLESLNLRGHRIGDNGAQALAAADTLSRLEILDLRYNRIGDTGAEALAASSSLTGLKRLVLQDNPIGPDGQAVLRARYGSAVEL